MRLPFSLFLALKYLKPKRSYFSVVTVISILGVLLGVAVLVIVLSVMSGFDEMWRDKILDFDAHLTIVGPEWIEDGEEIMAKVEKVQGVRGVAPFIQAPVVVRRGNEIITPVIRGVDPVRESRVSRIPANMIAGTFDLAEYRVVIGKDLAYRMSVSVGDKILVNAPNSFMSKDEIHLPEEYEISGIFDVGMWEYDAGFILCSLETAQELFGMGNSIHAVKVMVKDPYRAKEAAGKIAPLLKRRCSVKTWMDLNRQLFGALRVEKNMMFFLLIFITVVAAFGITNTLITVAVNKTKEIGLLKAIGFSSGSIMRIFFWQGWIDGMIGTTSGIVTGLAVLHYRNNLMHWLSSTFNMELFPKELYHLSEIPAQTSFIDIAVVAVSVVAICTLSGAIPAYRAAKLDPVEALRHE